MLRKIELTLCIVLYWMTFPFAWIGTKLITKLTKLTVNERLTEEEIAKAGEKYLERSERKDWAAKALSF